MQYLTIFFSFFTDINWTDGSSHEQRAVAHRRITSKYKKQFESNKAGPAKIKQDIATLNIFHYNHPNISIIKNSHDKDTVHYQQKVLDNMLTLKTAHLDKFHFRGTKQHEQYKLNQSSSSPSLLQQMIQKDFDSNQRRTCSNRLFNFPISFLLGESILVGMTIDHDYEINNCQIYYNHL